MSNNNVTVKNIARFFMSKAQGNMCPVCLGPFSMELHNHPLAPNFDHVWPRKGGTVERRGGWGNFLLTHTCCNEAKGDRNPTGCELLMLFAVNRAMGLPEYQTAKYDSPWDCGVCCEKR